MSLIKPNQINGIAPGGLGAHVSSFLDFGRSNTDLVSGQQFTHQGIQTNDPEIGSSVLFTSEALGTSATLALSPPFTTVFVYRLLGTPGILGGDGRFRFTDLFGGHTYRVQRDPFSSFQYQVELRGDFGNTITARYLPYPYAEEPFGEGQVFATTVDPLSSDPVAFAIDGRLVSPTASLGATKPFTSGAKTTPLANAVGAEGGTALAAVIHFDKILSTEELESITSDPWQVLDFVPDSVVEITQSELVPGGTISGTATNWTEGGPTTATLSAGGHEIEVALTSTNIGHGEYSFTGTLPARPPEGQSAAWVPYDAQATVEIS